MKIIVFGAGGQLGTELKNNASKFLQHQFIFKTSAEVDISNIHQVLNTLELERPNVVINAAAYTAVDKAESELKCAMLVNGTGVKNLAEACLLVHAKLIQVSTDFVFSGKAHFPYSTTEPVAPINVYGKSKAAGEGWVGDILGSNGLVVRTSWLYSAHSPCFLRTMLKVMSSRTEVNVVVDQIGTPTSVATLADWLLYAAENSLSGIYHVADAGVASWYDFAVAIQDLAYAQGLLESRCTVKPIFTSEYPTAAQRPHYSVMDTRLSFGQVGAPLQLYWSHALALSLCSVQPRSWES